MTERLSPISLLNAGRLTEAEQAARIGVADSPDRVDTTNIIAVVLFRRGCPAVAAQWFARAARIAPELAEILVNLIVSLQAGGQAELAADRCRALLALQPSSAWGYGQLGGILNDRGDLTGAVRCLRRAVHMEPEGIQDRFNHALLSHVTGAPTEEALARLVALQPADVGIYAQQGAVRLTSGRVDEASGSFGRVLRLLPQHADASLGLERCRRYRAAMAAARNAALPSGVEVRGPFTPISGYGHMTCRFLDHLLARGMKIHTLGLFGSEEWPGTGAPVRASAALSFLIPPAVEVIPGLRTIVFSMFEGTLVPPHWMPFSERHDLVVVPCESSRRAWADRGYPAERLRVCPLGVDVQPAAAPLPITDLRGRPVSEYRVRILNVSDFIPRKNVDGLLRVWLRATRADDDAVLILKLGKGSAGAAIEDLLAKTEKAVGRSRHEAAALAIVDCRLSEDEMNGLYGASTVYWSLSRGEGWDLPLTRAGAFGLGLVAPRHSAYVDYLDDFVARLIPARTAPAHMPYSNAPWPAFHGLDWWEPDEDAACGVIGAIAAGRDTALPDARSHLARNFGWDRAAARLQSILEEVSPS